MDLPGLVKARWSSSPPIIKAISRVAVIARPVIVATDAIRLRTESRSHSMMYSDNKNGVFLLQARPSRGTLYLACIRI
jgi:hypothetical protein